jgi:hypothetical protein
VGSEQKAKGRRQKAESSKQIVEDRRQKVGGRKLGVCPLPGEMVSRYRRFHQPEPCTVRCRAERDG